MSKTALEKALHTLEHITPLQSDCGALCGGLCCKGDDKTGMLLFAGEEERYTAHACMRILRQDGRSLLVCGGSCERGLRPLSCRMYPLFPLLYEDGGREYLKVIFDPRGTTCPLLRREPQLTRRFYKAVQRAGKQLLKDPEQYAVLKDISALLLETMELGSALYK